VPVQLDHCLHRHPLFSESALAGLIERVDRRDYYVNAMNLEAHDVHSRREGEICGLSGEEVLEAVKHGHFWILLLRPDKIEPEYVDLLHAIYREMARQVPGLKPYLLKMTILISSPRVQVYYHCDIPGQTLWQVRGHKRVYVYPNREPFLNQACLERIALRQVHEISLPYDERFDEHAVVYDLQPGQMLHWPLNAPHRVVNGDCVNISFATEHFTAAIRRKYFVNCANGILRQHLGRQQLSQQTSGVRFWAKCALVAAYKLSGWQAKRRKTLRIDFRVDPSAPGCIRSIPCYELQE
jgi:hypothetical protein